MDDILATFYCPNFSKLRKALLQVIDLHVQYDGLLIEFKSNGAIHDVITDSDNVDFRSFVRGFIFGYLAKG